MPDLVNGKSTAQKLELFNNFVGQAYAQKQQNENAEYRTNEKKNSHKYY